jgi:hypothetical protein
MTGNILDRLKIAEARYEVEPPFCDQAQKIWSFTGWPEGFGSEAPDPPFAEGFCGAA